ncbi:MAG: hypothetical protein KDC34_14085 [Saprospiraceae bacterium]|nr:hypothetical protein [Saprospiraceae bacterium]
MKSKSNIDLLKKIEKVSAPPFLFTRIEARINQQPEDRIPIKWAYAMSLGLAVLFCFNLLLIRSDFRKSKKAESLQIVVEEMDLHHSNQLYYE